jgi:hypothetical protein
MKIAQRIRIFSANAARILAPSESAWRAAATSVFSLGFIAMGFLFTTTILPDFAWQKLPAFFVLVGVMILAGFAVLLVAALIMRIPKRYRYALAVSAPFILVMIFPGKTGSKILAGTTLLLIISLIGGSLGALHGKWPDTRHQKKVLFALVLGISGLFAGLYTIFSDKPPANPALQGYVLEDRTLELPNPGLAGPYNVLTLTYGSGTDRWRPEFGEAVDLVSRSVDASKLIENWEGLSGWLRTSYWGFDVTELPLQARVWFPEGDGPFPVVLIVHGNHDMEDYSDPGYEYLGELLASRGIIVASVDQNFINFAVSSMVDIFADRPGLKEENDARGWLLLEHLALWRDWSIDPDSPFYNKIDTDRFALIGHSRGGEAVGIAAAFNALDRYPDDASLDFDYGFDLRGVIAIAPVYGQYQPRERPTPVRDVNYFTIHGSMDGDVQSFEGMAQYSRVAFTGDDYRFRSGLYVIGANHGQFNTTWGDVDTWAFDAWSLDRAGIMDGEAQRDVARVYFSAFLEIVLNDRTGYLPIFRDARYAAGWLPESFYINQFSDSQETTLANFEEDIDPTTMTYPGGRVSVQNASRWYETGNKLKWDKLDTHSLIVAWDRKFTPEKARVDFAFATATAADTLVASISAIDIKTLPEGFYDESAIDDSEESNESDQSLDWTIELSDALGNRVSLPLSADSALYPLINAMPRRAKFLESEEITEVLFRRFQWPMSAFTAVNPEFDISSVTQVSFVFDRSEKGAIIIDDISMAGGL